MAVWSTARGGNMARCTSHEASTSTTGRLRRSVGCFIRSTALGAAAAAVAMGFAMAQSVIATYGYSRATLPGIPGQLETEDQKRGTQGSAVFPLKYYLYVEVKRGSPVSADGAWVRGRYYNCRLTKVSTPVLVESDPGVPTEKKETLVPKTSNDVYSVVLGEAKSRTASNGQERELIASNEALIALVVNKSEAYAAIRSIKTLRPAAAP